MTPDVRREYLHEALGWVNHVRHSMGARPIPDWPKAIPGSERDCLLARAIKQDNQACHRVRIGSNHYEVEYLPPLRPRHEMCSTRWAESGDPISVSAVMPRMQGDQGQLPYPCGKVVRMFDNGELPQYISDEETKRRNMAATPPHLHTPVHLDKPLTATEIGKMWESMKYQVFSPPTALAALCPAPPMPELYKAPDWASMLKTPEAPVKAPTEEPELA